MASKKDETIRKLERKIRLVHQQLDDFDTGELDILGHPKFGRGVAFASKQIRKILDARD